MRYEEDGNGYRNQVSHIVGNKLAKKSNIHTILSSMKRQLIKKNTIKNSIQGITIPQGAIIPISWRTFGKFLTSFFIKVQLIPP